MNGSKRRLGPAGQDARRAVSFMLAKFALFAVAPVIAAGSYRLFYIAAVT